MTRTVKEHFLECHECGSQILERDEPLWGEDEEEACAECGVIHRISIYEDNDGNLTANAVTDEHAKDVGQPHCLNECGNIYMPSAQAKEEFFDKPCRWNCDKTKAWVATGGKLPVRQ